MSLGTRKRDTSQDESKEDLRNILNRSISIYRSIQDSKSRTITGRAKNITAGARALVSSDQTNSISNREILENVRILIQQNKTTEDWMLLFFGAEPRAIYKLEDYVVQADGPAKIKQTGILRLAMHIQKITQGYSDTCKVLFVMLSEAMHHIKDKAGQSPDSGEAATLQKEIDAKKIALTAKLQVLIQRKTDTKKRAEHQALSDEIKEIAVYLAVMGDTKAFKTHIELNKVEVSKDVNMFAAYEYYDEAFKTKYEHVKLDSDIDETLPIVLLENYPAIFHGMYYEDIQKMVQAAQATTPPPTTNTTTGLIATLSTNLSNLISSVKTAATKNSAPKAKEEKTRTELPITETPVRLPSGGEPGSDVQSGGQDLSAALTAAQGIEGTQNDDFSRLTLTRAHS